MTINKVLRVVVVRLLMYLITLTDKGTLLIQVKSYRSLDGKRKVEQDEDE